jgi:hypothetical protein
MANGPISWKSARQAAVTFSTTGAEYYGYTSASREAKWLRNLLQELCYTGKDLQPMVIHGDNQSAMKWSENPEQHQRSKHVGHPISLYERRSCKGFSCDTIHPNSGNGSRWLNQTPDRSKASCIPLATQDDPTLARISYSLEGVC